MNKKKLNVFAKAYLKGERECMEDLFESKSKRGELSGQECRIGRAYFNKVRRRSKR